MTRSEDSIVTLPFFVFFFCRETNISTTFNVHLKHVTATNVQCLSLLTFTGQMKFARMSLVVFVVVAAAVCFSGEDSWLSIKQDGSKTRPRPPVGWLRSLEHRGRRPRGWDGRRLVSDWPTSVRSSLQPGFGPEELPLTERCLLGGRFRALWT